MNDIKKQIFELIENEKVQNPLKDIELANVLGVERGYITQIRKKLEIPDSRIRYRNMVTAIVEDIVAKKKYFKMRDILEELGGLGYEVSRYLLRDILKNNVTLTDRDVSEKNQDNDIRNSDAFSKIIGYDGSLQNAIKLAKAAIMYPPHGLNTIILGASGVGKNLLVSRMHEYALESGIMESGSELVTFNCADYSDNPQLLLSILFGVKKGAFTGANEDRVGLIERADKGILFLDEIHRMPPKGQEILFQMIDTGKFRRLGESMKDSEIQTLLICATTEKPDNCLLDTFLRRIPMVISLPSLNDRSIEERMELMRYYLSIQASRLKKKIKISKDACQAFLLYDPIGNIGKFFNDIQVCLAKGYLKSLSEDLEYVSMELDELPNEIQKGILKANLVRDQIKYLITGKEIVIEIDEGKRLSSIEYNGEIVNDSIYEFIDYRFNELRETHFQRDEINNIIGDEVEHRIMNRLMGKTKNVEKGNIIKIIGSHMTNIVENALMEVEDGIVEYDDHFFFTLAFHINETVKRLKANKMIINPRLEQTRNNYPSEFIRANKITEFLSRELAIHFPEEETAYIAMYLKSYESKKIEPCIGILVMTHGSIADNLVKLAQDFMAHPNIRSLEMDLEDHPESILKKAADEVRKLDQGKGVLIMVDMGSLATFGPLIHEITGIYTRTLKRVEIVTLLEAVRISQRAETTLNEVCSEIIKLQEDVIQQFDSREMIKKKPAIVTTCITGQGSAIYLKEMLDRSLEQLNVDIIPMGVLSSHDIKAFIENLKNRFHLICTVGTVNPQIGDVPYISMVEVLKGDIEQRISKLYRLYQEDETLRFDDQLLFVEDSIQNKGEAIEFLCDHLMKSGCVTDKYMEDVWAREKIGTTCMLDITENGVVILHSMTSREVIKDSFAVLKLKQPIKWDYIEIDVIFTIAVANESVKFPEHINRYVLKDPEVMNAIRAAKDHGELKLILNRTIAGNK